MPPSPDPRLPTEGVSSRSETLRLLYHAGLSLAEAEAARVILSALATVPDRGRRMLVHDIAYQVAFGGKTPGAPKELVAAAGRLGLND
jgi:hypothetical protein